MTAYALLPLGAFVLVCFVLVYVYAQPRSDSLHRAFLLTAATILCWIGLELFTYLPLSNGVELTILRTIALFWIPIGVVFLHFIYRLLGRPLDLFLKLSAAAAIAGVGVVWSTDWCLRGFERVAWGVADLRGPLHTSMTLVPSVPTLVGLWLVQRARRSAGPPLRPVFNLILVGGGLGFSTAMVLNMALPNLLGVTSVPRFGSSALGLFCLAIYVAVRRHDFLTVSVEQAAEDIFASSLDGLVLLDQDGRLARLNPAAKKLLRLTDGQSHPDLEVRPRLETLLPGLDSGAGSQVVAVDQGSSERFYSITRTVLVSRDGRPRGEILVLRDITAFKEAEQVLQRSKSELEAEVLRRTEELRQAQKMEELGRLAGGVAHDFNNLLAVIIGFATAGHDDLDENHPVRDDLKEILRAADNGRRTVQQLLTFSRKAKAEIVPVNVGRTVSDAVRLFAVSLPPSVILRSELSQGSFRALGDANQLQQVIINLLSNAAYAMRGGEGVLEVRMTVEELDGPLQLGHALLLPGQYVRIDVSDTGCGMSPETLGRLFEPFFTTKPTGEGTGLGLATALGIIDAHGGALSVTSALKVGTTFSIHLPLLADERVSTIPDDDAFAPTGHERVLLVDDEEQVLRGLRRMIEPLGYAVESTSSSLEALELLRSTPRRCDLLITDQVMPALTGLELIGHVRELHSDLPVILLSGFSNTVTEARLAEAKVAAFLRKPLRKAELARAIRTTLDSATRGAQDEPITRSTAAS